MRTSLRVFIKILIGILAALAIALTVFLIFALSTRRSLFIGSLGHSENVAIDEAYSQKIDVVDIRSEAGNVIIRQSSDKQAHLKVYGEDSRVSAEVSESVIDTDRQTIIASQPTSRLTVRTEAVSCVFLCFGDIATLVELYLPTDFAGTINIESDYGNVEIAEFPKAAMDIDNDCGNLNIASVAKLRADVDLGNIEVGHVTKQLSIRGDCGNVKIDSLEIAEDSNIELSLGNVEIRSAGQIYIDATSSIGKVDINNNHREADLTLNIKNSCGNTTVRN